MTNGAPCKGVRKGLKPGATQGAPRRARQTAVVAVLQFGTCDVAVPAHRAPPHPYIRQHICEGSGCTPPYGTIYDAYETVRRHHQSAAHAGRTDVDVWRGTAKRAARLQRRTECQSSKQQPPTIGARSEGRLAWPHAPSSSGHACKAPRPMKPRIVFGRAPGVYRLLLLEEFPEQAWSLAVTPGWGWGAASAS
jgi:hypothetical protein